MPQSTSKYSWDDLLEDQEDEREYKLEVVQTPQRTAEFGSAGLSRLPLSPPLVVRLTVLNRGIPIPADTELPFLVANLKLYSANGTEPLDECLHSQTNQRHKMLYGTLVSSTHQLFDESNQAGTFFVFPDVSVRMQGRYKLRITLMRLAHFGEMSTVPVGDHGKFLIHTWTDSFDVVPLAQFVAPATTPLTRLFHRQGVRMGAVP